VVIDAENIPKGSCQKTRALETAEALPSARPEAKRNDTCSVMMKIDEVTHDGKPLLHDPLEIARS
jgi:hypothetical protein